MGVTPQQILQAREYRAGLQQEFIHTYGLPLVCFTMNIAGPEKDSPLIRRAFHFGCQMLLAAFHEHHVEVAAQQTRLKHTGCEAYYAVRANAHMIKKLCTGIEDSSPLGRLFDMDVLDETGTQLHREEVGGHTRGCIVCGASGRGCASRRLHTVEQLQAVTIEILCHHFQQEDQHQISTLALRSLLDEVCVTPKPGLVDRVNSGSHKDMDIFTFTASASALSPYLSRCVALGQQTKELSPDETFARLRRTGIQAEQDMFQATGGINTHKGAIFTMGTVCGAIGRLWNAEQPCRNLTAILDMCAQMTQRAIDADFRTMTMNRNGNLKLTTGQRLYLQQGIKGIRGEIAAGLPSVSRIGIPVLRRALAAGKHYNDAAAITLLYLIAHVSDTNMIARGGLEEARQAMRNVQALLADNPLPDWETISRLDQTFIEKNLSPGGCADLLAVTLFLHHWCESES